MKVATRLYLFRRLLRLRTWWAAFLHDIAWIPTSILLGFWVRFNFDPIPPDFLFGAWMLTGIAIPVQGILFWNLGLYRGIWRFASLPDLIRIFKAVSIGNVTIFTIAYLLRIEGIPRSLIFLYPILLAVGLSCPRLAYRWIKDHRFRMRDHDAKRTLVIGAGKAADTLVQDLVKQGRHILVGILDDDPRKKGRDIYGIPIIGRLDAIEDVIIQYDVELVLLAIPSASARLIQRIFSTCQGLGVDFRTLPSLAEIADGRIETSSLREIRIEDLLGREPVQLDTEEISRFLKGKRVLVTGAGGSIGSELCRQITMFRPQELILVDNGEYNLYQIEKEMNTPERAVSITTFLGDVRDESRMRFIFGLTRPEIVFHAAAFKHVPLVEKNPIEGVKTNVFGTKIVTDVSREFGVEKFVLVSTDKAVNPGNVMGASKRIAEIYCQNLNGRSSTLFITTRFGNVLGSSGSVIPLFKEQIAKGGPVTVTHKDMTRYFMTIPESCQLILQAGAIGEGGEIFVLDMGEPVRIVHLAEEMIRLSGLEAGRDIEIVYTGIRAGEKLHEELFHPSETPIGTRHPKIKLALSRAVDLRWIEDRLSALEKACEAYDIPRLRQLLTEMVPEYPYSSAPASTSSQVRTNATVH
ncbi:MAG: polysaccharide biosynthesis protein [Deltaproteobacteria bacterium]